MSRLITEDAVYEYLTDKFNEYDISIENEFVGKILDGLGDIPTAYDVEKVVKKLKQDTPYITKNGVEFITVGDAVCTVRKGEVE